VLQSMRPDARVQYPQEHAPTDETAARAVISLANALAKGDASAMGALLVADAKADLNSLTGSGDWAEATGRIEGVRVVGLNNLGDSMTAQMNSATVYLAIQEPGRSYILGFYAERTGDAWLFAGSPATRETRARAMDFDGMSSGELGDPARAGSGGALVAALPGGGPAAGMGSMADKMAAAAYLMYTVPERIMRDAQMPFDASAAKAQAAAMGADASMLDTLLKQGKSAIDKGVLPEDAIIVQAVDIGKQIAATTAGKINDDRVIQIVSNILQIPENRVRSIYDKAKGTGGTTPPPSPGGRGAIPPAGG